MIEDAPKPMNSVALLVVDMQPGFMKVIPNRKILIARTCFALEAAAHFGFQVYFTEQSPGKLGPTDPDLFQASGLSPESLQNRVFPKSCFSAMEADSLHSRLADDGIEHLLIAGIEAPICIYQTALTALEQELQITLLSDCIGGRREEDISPVFDVLRDSGCFVLPSECVYYSLLKSAEHPAFREMTALVKKYAAPL